MMQSPFVDMRIDLAARNRHQTYRKPREPAETARLGNDLCVQHFHGFMFKRIMLVWHNDVRIVRYIYVAAIVI